MSKGQKHTIQTDFIHPPIPTRDHDWQAFFDGYEPGDFIGHGKTEVDAIIDLITQWSERYE